MFFSKTFLRLSTSHLSVMALGAFLSVERPIKGKGQNVNQGPFPVVFFGRWPLMALAVCLAWFRLDRVGDGGQWLDQHDLFGR